MDAPTFGTHLEDAGYGLHVFGKTDYRVGGHSLKARLTAWMRAANIKRPHNPRPQATPTTLLTLSRAASSSLSLEGEGWGEGGSHGRHPRRQQPIPPEASSDEKSNTYPPTGWLKSTTPANSSPTTQLTTRPTSSIPAPTSPIPPSAPPNTGSTNRPPPPSPSRPTNLTSTPSWTT